MIKLEVVEEKVNRLLKRKEMTYTVETEGSTPSRAELQRLIAAKNGVKEDTIVIGYIKQRFGQQSSDVFAKVYESAKAAVEIEKKYALERTEKSKEKEKAAKEKPKEEAPKVEEKKPEEKKEEKKPEEAAPEKKEEKKPEVKKEETKPKEKKEASKEEKKGDA